MNTGAQPVSAIRMQTQVIAMVIASGNGGGGVSLYFRFSEQFGKTMADRYAARGDLLSGTLSFVPCGEGEGNKTIRADRQSPTVTLPIRYSGRPITSPKEKVQITATVQNGIITFAKADFSSVDERSVTRKGTHTKNRPPANNEQTAMQRLGDAIKAVNALADATGATLSLNDGHLSALITLD